MIRKLVRGAIVAALYVVVTFVFAPVSFSTLIQFRASEALTVLPIIFPESVVGLYLGVMLANVLGGLGPIDIFGGSLVTLLAAYLTYRTRGSWLAYIWPIALNGLLISLYLAPIIGVPYWVEAGALSLSEGVVVLALGYPLVRWLRSRKIG
jgi:uncharacterized membrane protein